MTVESTWTQKVEDARIISKIVAKAQALPIQALVGLVRILCVKGTLGAALSSVRRS